MAILFYIPGTHCNGGFCNPKKQALGSSSPSLGLTVTNQGPVARSKVSANLEVQYRNPRVSMVFSANRAQTTGVIRDF